MENHKTTDQLCKMERLARIPARNRTIHRQRQKFRHAHAYHLVDIHPDCGKNLWPLGQPLIGIFLSIGVNPSSIGKFEENRIFINITSRILLWIGWSLISIKKRKENWLYEFFRMMNCILLIYIIHMWR